MRLRHLLAAAFTVVATVPVIFLGAWVERSSMENELAMVHEKHLLLAGNITAALERYAKDTEAALDLFISLSSAQPLGGETAKADFSGLARQLGFRHFCILDAEGNLVDLSTFTPEPRGEMPEGMLKEIDAALDEAGPGDDILFSRVVNDSTGHAVIYMARRVGRDLIGLAALDTAYIVKLQKAIAFGRKGHAAIVDHKGNLIAHPNPQWTSEHKNIAKVEPVRRMLLGETGVTTFFSPAMLQDMISGFNTVSGPGWGVMVPQPIGELEERAQDVLFVALAIGLIGIATASFIAWFLAGSLARPVQAVLRAARDIAAGHLEARVETPPSRLLPSEFDDLAQGFNSMAGTIETDKAELERALAAAQQADRAKSEFLAAMSHELRTPLNSIIGFSDVIRSAPKGSLGSPEQLSYIDDIHQAGQHLLAIINDILDLSKIEAGLLEIPDDPVDSQGMIRGVFALIDQRPERTGVALSLELASDLPVVRGSEVKLRQVLVNLLSNALKFTPAGGEVVLSAWREEDGELSIRVADSGIGMTPEEVVVALTPFSQVDGSLSRQYEGTGLGLPLAKRLIDLHGGTMVIESTPGEGTRILVRLPGPRSLAKAA